MLDFVFRDYLTYILAPVVDQANLRSLVKMESAMNINMLISFLFFSYFSGGKHTWVDI